jgi:hypothetical protein
MLAVGASVSWWTGTKVIFTMFTENHRVVRDVNSYFEPLCL